MEVPRKHCNQYKYTIGTFSCRPYSHKYVILNNEIYAKNMNNCISIFYSILLIPMNNARSILTR